MIFWFGPDWMNAWCLGGGRSVSDGTAQYSATLNSFAMICFRRLNLAQRSWSTPWGNSPETAAKILTKFLRKAY
jgi:hypothetical protein